MTAFAPAPSGSKEVVASQIPATYLIPSSQWTSRRSEALRILGLEQEPREHLEALANSTEAVIQHLGETEITESETLRLEEGRIVLSPASMEEFARRGRSAERPRCRTPAKGGAGGSPDRGRLLDRVHAVLPARRWGSISKSGSGAPRVRGDPGPGLQLRPHDDGRPRRFDLPPARMDHGLVPARGDAQSCLLGSRGLPSTSFLLPRPGAVEPSPPPMASDSPFEARRRTRPRSRNISASEGASLSTPGPRTSTRSTGRRSSRLRFVTRPMSSTRSSITRPIFRSSSTRRTPLATPRSSSPCFIFWGCSSPPASGTWALSACIVSMLLRGKKGSRFC